MKTRTIRFLLLFFCAFFLLGHPNSILAEEKCDSYLMDTDLELSITSSTSTLTSWTNITFEVIVQNTSITDATGVTVDFSFPSSTFAYIGQYQSAGTYYSWTGDWIIGTVEANSTDTLQVTLYVLDDSSPVTLLSEVKIASPNDSDSTPGNIGGTAAEDDEGAVTVGGPPGGGADIEVVLNAAQSTFQINQSIIFTVVVENHGSQNATGLEISYPIPAGFTYSSHSNPLGSYNQTTGVWDLGPLASNTLATLDVTLIANQDINPVTHFVELIAANETDPNSTPNNGAQSPAENDESTVVVTPVGTQGADIEIEFLAPVPSEIAAWQNTTFKIDVTNSGPLTATNVVVKITYPASGFWAYTSAAPISMYDNYYNQWTIPTLASGATQTVEVVLFALQQASSTDFFAEVVSVTENDPNSTPNNGAQTPPEDDETELTIYPVGQTPFSVSGVVTAPTNSQGDNGSVDITVAGGTSPYTYLWSNGAATEDISNLVSGVYSVTVTDANSQTATGSFTVPAGQSSLTVTGIAAAPTNSQGDNGSVDITVAGGTSPYTYLWSNGATAEDILNLVSGVYSVTVTDANSQTATGSFTVPTGQSSIAVTGIVSTPTNTQGDNGSIDITVTGGTSPYTYLWSNGATTEDITNLVPGNYSITVTDANNQTANNSFVVSAAGVVDVVWRELPIDVFQNGDEYKKLHDNRYLPLRGCNELSTNESGFIEFELQDDIINLDDEFYIGFIDTSSSINPLGSNDPDFILAFQGSTIRVTEKGNQPLNSVVSGGNAGEIYKIEKDQNGVIKYYQNGTLFYTSTIPAATLTLQPVILLFQMGTDRNVNVDINSSSPCNEIIPKVKRTDIVYSNNGSIDLLTEGGFPNYSYLWNNNATTEDLLNITTPGNYKVTINDQLPQSEIVEVDVFSLVDNTWTEGLNNDLTIVENNYLKTASGYKILGSCNEILTTEDAIFEVELLNDFVFPDEFAFGFNEKGSSVFYDKYYGISMNSSGYVVHNNAGTIPVTHYPYLGAGVKFSVKLKDGDFIFYKNDKEFERIENVSFGSDTLVANVYFNNTKPTGLDLDFKISKDCVDPMGMNSVVWMDVPTGTTMGNKYTTNTEALNLEGCNILKDTSNGYLELVVEEALTGTEKVVFGLAAPNQSIVLDNSYQGFAQDFYSIEINASNSALGDTFRIEKSFNTFIGYTQNSTEFSATENLPNSMALSPYMFVCSDAGQNEFKLNVTASFDCELNYVLKKEEALDDSLGMIELMPYGNGMPGVLWGSGSTSFTQPGLSSGAYDFSIFNTQNDTIARNVTLYESSDLEWEVVPSGVTTSGDSILNTTSLDQLLWGCGELMTGDTGFIRIKILESSASTNFSIGLAPAETVITNPDDQLVYGLKFEGDYGMGITGDNLLMESPLCMSQDEGVTYKIEKNSAGEIVFYKNERPFYTYSTAIDTVLKPVIFLDGSTDDFEIAIQTSFGCGVEGNDGYVKLEKKLDGSYTRTYNEKLKIKYIESYSQRDANTISQVDYRILDWAQDVKKSGKIDTGYGANFRTINTSGLNSNEFYTLEVKGPNKDEIYYLRFQNFTGSVD